MSGVLQDKVAIVTGRGRGLGRAHALALAEAGAAVVVNDLGGGLDGNGNDTGPAQSVVAEIVASGGRAVADGHDVSDWEQARAIVATATSAFGRLDVVVDNAGVSRFASIDEETAEGWNRVIGINLTGSAAVSAAAAHWRQAGPEPGRALINTTSPAGLNPLPGTPAYCASKAAVCALTMTTAADLADLGVRVNAIAPIARTRMSDVPALADAMRPWTRASTAGRRSTSPPSCSSWRRPRARSPAASSGPRATTCTCPRASPRRRTRTTAGSSGRWRAWRRPSRTSTGRTAGTRSPRRAASCSRSLRTKLSQP